jgi:hypothetical protein
LECRKYTEPFILGSFSQTEKLEREKETKEVKEKATKKVTKKETETDNIECVRGWK